MFLCQGPRGCSRLGVRSWRLAKAGESTGTLPALAYHRGHGVTLQVGEKQCVASGRGEGGFPQ